MFLALAAAACLTHSGIYSAIVVAMAIVIVVALPVTVAAWRVVMHRVKV